MDDDYKIGRFQAQKDFGVFPICCLRVYFDNELQMFCWLFLFCYYPPKKRRLDICVLLQTLSFVFLLSSVFFSVSGFDSDKSALLALSKLWFWGLRENKVWHHLPCEKRCRKSINQNSVTYGDFNHVWLPALLLHHSYHYCLFKRRHPEGIWICSHIYTTPLLCLNDQHALFNKTLASTLLHPALLMMWWSPSTLILIHGSLEIFI